MREFTFGLSGATTTTGIAVLGATSLNISRAPAAPSINVEFLRHWIGQAANATSAQQRVEFSQAVPTSLVVVGATPAKLKMADPNVSALVSGTSGAAGTCGVNATTELSGTNTMIWDDVFNVLNGYLKVATPVETEVFPAGFANVSRLWFITAPTTLTGWTWGQNFREI
jgi:hypothetical protein